MGILADEFTGKLITDKEIKSNLKSRASNYVHESVDKRDAEDYEGKGWEREKETKKKVIFKKPKKHFTAFEDRMWVVLAKMGFTTLNKSDLKLPYTADHEIPGKQIDVFAADNETIILVECKSAQEMKKEYFSKELNEYEKVISGGNKVLKKAFTEKHKIRYIFATNNIILSDNDRKRLRDLNMIHFNQDDIHYYEQLLNTVGSAAKYQLLARLFKDQEIPALDNKTPAVRGKMGGYYYYSFSIEPEKLLKISYILHRVNVNSSDGGYQRLVTKGRLKEIENFINGGGYFPNSIILNINTKKEEPLNFDKVSCTHDSKITEPVILHLPKKYHSAFIIDGQHRLYGYSNTKYKETNSIPVVAFENLPADEQIELFVQINSKQRPVSKNLLTTIVADIMWNSDKYDAALEAFMSRLLSDLGTRDDSPLYRRIMLGDKKKTPTTCITLDTTIIHGFKKSMLFAKLNKKKLAETGYLWCDPAKEDGTIDYQDMLDKSYLFFRTYFDHIKEKTIDIWNLGNDPGGFIAMNIGVVCFIRLANDILGHIKKYEGEDFHTKSGKEMAEMVITFLDPVITYVNGFDISKINNFRKYATSPSGVDMGVREFQHEIHKSFKAFDPDGLQKWIIDNSGKFNDIARNFIDKVEEGIKAIIYLTLEERFEGSWWKDAVPSEIQKRAALTRIDEKSDVADSEFINLPDYKAIVSKHWETIFKPIFADPEIKSNKDNQLKWFDKFIPLRNKIVHKRGKATQEDQQFITKLNEWLPARLEIAKINVTE